MFVVFCSGTAFKHEVKFLGQDSQKTTFRIVLLLALMC